MIKTKLLASLLLGWLTLSTAHAADLVDRIIAVAGQDVVMLSELRAKAQKTLLDLQRAGTNPMPSRDQILSRSLDELILEKLQLAMAERLGIEADPDTVAKAIEGIAGNNNMSVPQLREALAAEGMPFRDFQNNIRNQLVLRRLISREVTGRIQISSSEVDQYLARQAAAADTRGQVHLLHILVNTPDGASSEQIRAAAQKAQKLRERIEGGEDFRAVAQAESDGPRAIQGGDLGWANFGQLTEQLAQLVGSMQVGDIAGPFRSSDGFHLLRLEEQRSSEQTRSVIQQTNARHILIRTDEVTSDADAQTRLLQLRERALQGDDFANLARSSSADQASAIKGGDLGWVNPGNMVDEFEEMMNQTAAGEISMPFKSRFGWHIVQVLERRAHDQTDEARRIEARKAVLERKSEEATQQYLRRLRDEAYVELRLTETE